MSESRLIIGVDGGGSKTAARVAGVSNDGADVVTLGEGFGGPSNVRAVGREHARINLDVAIDAAHREAGTAGKSVEHAVLALAGSSLPDVQQAIIKWAHERNLAHHVEVVHDADPVLAAGSPAGHGIALIVGTGSVAIGIDPDGRRVVTGGWGHWFGDQGSGYDLGKKALTAIANAEDGIGEATVLTDAILAHLGTTNAREILQILSRSADMRREIASLAPHLLKVAQTGDAVSLQILKNGAAAAARLVSATVARLDCALTSPLALAGGIACSVEMYRRMLLQEIESLGLKPAPVSVVKDPVEGSLLLARDRLVAMDGSSDE